LGTGSRLVGLLMKGAETTSSSSSSSSNEKYLDKLRR
jgi:hypothetical protein